MENIVWDFADISMRLVRVLKRHKGATLHFRSCVHTEHTQGSHTSFQQNAVLSIDQPCETGISLESRWVYLESLQGPQTDMTANRLRQHFTPNRKKLHFKIRNRKRLEYSIRDFTPNRMAEVYHSCYKPTQARHSSRHYMLVCVSLYCTPVDCVSVSYVISYYVEYHTNDCIIDAWEKRASAVSVTPAGACLLWNPGLQVCCCSHDWTTFDCRHVATWLMAFGSRFVLIWFVFWPVVLLTLVIILWSLVADLLHVAAFSDPRLQIWWHLPWQVGSHIRYYSIV